MQAILKGKHQRFCKMVDEVKAIQPVNDEQLIELETQLQHVYDKYQQQMTDLKLLIEVYEQKQKAIRNRLRQILYFQKFGNRKVQVAGE